MLGSISKTAVPVLLALMTLSCGPGGHRYQPPPEVRALQSVVPAYPAVTFAVISDPHFYDPELGSEGQAFQDYLDKDRKLLLESGPIIDAAVDRIRTLPADFVIVCGDLTKDGEKINHLKFEQKLRRLTASGKQVFVVPGNHDILNPEAVRFEGAKTEPVPGVTPDEFAEIYAAYGYRAAIDRSPDSLSYLVEPVDGLWLLAVDSCRWKENRPGHAMVSGAYSPPTRQWIEHTLIRAKQAGKAVIVFQHHGVLEHYPHNRKFYSRYLVDDDENVAAMLAAGGVQLVFTGHFHAQDITAKTYPDTRRTLVDIETGSLATAPCPYRIVRITKDRKAVIDSFFVDEIPAHGKGFADFAAEYVFNGTLKLSDNALKKFKVAPADRQRMNPQVSRAYVTHLKGDEQKPDPVYDLAGTGWWARFVMFMRSDLINGWYTDLPPADNRVTLDLNGGMGMAANP